MTAIDMPRPLTCRPFLADLSLAVRLLARRRAKAAQARRLNRALARRDARLLRDIGLEPKDVGAPDAYHCAVPRMVLRWG